MPALIAEANQLSHDGPQYIDRVRGTVNDFLASHHSIAGYKLPQNIDDLFAQFSDRAKRSSAVRRRK